MALGVYFTLLTLCAVFGTSVQQSTGCQDGWSIFENTCYHFGSERVTWIEANARCADIGAILAEPGTPEPFQYLSQITHDGPRGWWLGGSDRQTEGSWVWSSAGTHIDSSMWGPGEPAAWVP